MPSGSLSRLFWERQRSVRLVRPEISSGMYSNTFSDTSNCVNFFRFPISCNTTHKNQKYTLPEITKDWTIFKGGHSLKIRKIHIHLYFIGTNYL